MGELGEGPEISPNESALVMLDPPLECQLEHKPDVELAIPLNHLDIKPANQVVVAPGKTSPDFLDRQAASPFSRL